MHSVVTVNVSHHSTHFDTTVLNASITVVEFNGVHFNHKLITSSMSTFHVIAHKSLLDVRTKCWQLISLPFRQGCVGKTRWIATPNSTETVSQLSVGGKSFWNNCILGCVGVSDFFSICLRLSQIYYNVLSDLFISEVDAEPSFIGSARVTMSNGMDILMGFSFLFVDYSC